VWGWGEESVGSVGMERGECREGERRMCGERRVGEIRVWRGDTRV
jgi:hypothetical protein